MKIYPNSGGFIRIGEERAKKLLETGFFYDSPMAESAPEASNDEPEGEDTGDTVQDAPALPEAPEEAPKATERPAAAVVRAWAQKNNVEVSAKGQVSAEVYEKYAEANKN